MCIIHMHGVGKSSLSKCRCANNHRKWEFFFGILTNSRGTTAPTAAAKKNTQKQLIK